MAQTNEQNGSVTPNEHAPPAIAAAFMVVFDVRKGYTIAWQESVNDVKLDGVVEFKALPSGLHNIEEDLVYFVYEDYAGISAFLRRDDQEAERNARMLSVGVLLPLDAGRLGKSYLCAPELKELTRKLIEDPTDHTALDAFWESHKKAEPGNDRPGSSPRDDSPSEGYQKLRALSTISLGTPNVTRTLPVHHPALAIPEFLQVFGPLLFPLARAALLQKRILILGEAPVEITCNYVYNLSILSSISRSLTSFIPKFEPGKARLRPLFNIGISDIPLLEDIQGAWVACTTDDVLASKPKLFDVLVVLPNSTTAQKGGPRKYPRLILSTPELATTFPQHGLRATHRDARRYAAMKNALQTLPSSATLEAQLLESDSDADSIASSVSTVIDNREAIEQLPWSVVAYNSMIWWASAGDRRSGLLEAEEIANEQDEEILRDSIGEEGTTKEVAVIGYFHTLSTLLFEVLISVARRTGGGDAPNGYHDDEEPENAEDEDRGLLSRSENQEPVEIIEEDIRAMGLDIWSAMDKQFIVDMVEVWWQRKAIIRGGVIECCGIRLL